MQVLPTHGEVKDNESTTWSNNENKDDEEINHDKESEELSWQALKKPSVQTRQPNVEVINKLEGEQPWEALNLSLPHKTKNEEAIDSLWIMQIL